MARVSIRHDGPAAYRHCRGYRTYLKGREYLVEDSRELKLVRNSGHFLIIEDVKEAEVVPPPPPPPPPPPAAEEALEEEPAIDVPSVPDLESEPVVEAPPASSPPSEEPALAEKPKVGRRARVPSEPPIRSGRRKSHK